MAEEELSRESQKLLRELFENQQRTSALLQEFQNNTNKANKSTDKLVKSAEKTTKVFGSVYDAMLGFINRTATEAKEPIEVGLDFIKTSMESGKSILESVSGSAGVLGSFTDALKSSGLIDAAGKLKDGFASLLGTGVGTATDAFNLLTTQVLQNYNAFKVIQKSNILLGNGITELTTNAAMSGVPLKAFTKGLQLARTDLQNMGVGAGEATQRLSSVMGTVTRSSERYNIQLEALGYGTEEQMALMAQQMSLDRASGLDKSKNDKQVAASAVQLAKDMKVLADVTGEDAKKKMDEARKESMRASIMANMSAEESAKFVKAFSAVPKEAQQSVLEYFASGGQVVTNAAGAMMQSTNSQFDKTLKEIYAGVKNQNITGEQLQDMTLANVRATAEEQRRLNREDGTAAAADRAQILGKIGGPVESFTNLANSFSQNMIGQVEESRKRAEQAANLEKMDPVTRMALEMKAFGEAAQRQTQNLLNAPLKGFTNVVNEFTGVLAKATENARVRADVKLGMNVLKSPPIPGGPTAGPVPDFKPPTSLGTPPATPGKTPVPDFKPPTSLGTPPNTLESIPKVSISAFDKPMPVQIQNADAIAAALKGIEIEKNKQMAMIPEAMKDSLQSFMTSKTSLSNEDKIFYNDMRTLLTEQNSLLKTNLNLAQGMLDGIGDVYSRLNNQRA